LLEAAPPLRGRGSCVACTFTTRSFSATLGHSHSLCIDLGTPATLRGLSLHFGMVNPSPRDGATKPSAKIERIEGGGWKTVSCLRAHSWSPSHAATLTRANQMGTNLWSIELVFLAHSLQF
jgi:hypothetical protein